MQDIEPPMTASAIVSQPLYRSEMLKRSIIMALAAAASILPLSLSDYWLNSIFIPMLTMGLAGVGLNLLMGYAGCVSLGSAAFMAVGAFSAYNLLLHVPVLPLPLVIILAGLMAALVGVLFGLPSLRIKGFYLAASTLAAQFFFEWLFTNFPWFCNYNISLVITAPRLEIFGWNLKSTHGRYMMVIVTTLSLVALAYGVIRSRVGREWIAISDKETAANIIGIKVGSRRLLAFGVSSFYCGVAGTLWAFCYLQTSNAFSFNLDKSFVILFIVIIGGTASIFGNFVGAAFIVLTPIFLDLAVARLGLTDYVNIGVTTNLQRMLFGVMIIYVLIKEPDGLYRLLQRLVASLSPNRRSSTVSSREVSQAGSPPDHRCTRRT
jgi:branched-chain amino acid transport system permease protein